jgi:hypothetical protein
MYRNLAPEHIHVTIERLERRIAARFPTSSLRKVAAELCAVSRETMQRIELIQRPHLPLRIGVAVIVITILVLVLATPIRLKHSGFETWLDVITGVEAGVGSLFFLAAAGAFLWSLELRVKRGRVFSALHELRSLAHIVDMHQLPKDPLPREPSTDTEFSPVRELTRFELTRYFTYCSELLSLVSKIAALYVRNLNDSHAIGAVDEIEELCTGLSQKIWQKIDVLRVGCEP